MTAQLKIQNDGLNMFRVKSTIDTEKEKLGLELGSLISAVVTSKSNGVAQLTAKENFSFEADSSKINGNVGDELYFEVVKTGKKEFTLKQIQQTNPSPDQTFSKMKSVANMKEMFKQNNFLSDEKVLKDSKTRNEEAEAERKTAEALAGIRRQISNATGDKSINAMNELIASGVSLSKISLPMLAGVMKEINIKPQLKAKSKSAENAAAHGEAALADSPEAVTGAENPEIRKSSTSNADKYTNIQKLTENEIINLIKDKKELTLKNIYIARHTAPPPSQSKDDAKEVYGKLPDDLESEILKVLEGYELPLTSDNIEMSKTLISNDIDLTKENILKFIFLNNLDGSQIKSILKDISEDRAVRNNNVYDINLYKFHDEKTKDLLYKNYAEIISSLPNINATGIDSLLSRQKQVTLKNLKNITQSEYVSPKAALAGEVKETAEITSVKRQLAEIRLKLTHEAALRLVGKNISIDTLPLTDAVNVLKQQESEIFASNLRVVGAEANWANIGSMMNLYEKMSSFASVSQNALTNVVGGITAFGHRFDVLTTSNAIEAARATELYEQNSTPAIKGPVFSDLKEKLKEHLERLNVDSNEKNLKAAEILFNNKLEINEENINRVKLIEAKIDRIYNTLHPNIAANMIKEGLNPLEMHIDEMLEYTEKFSDIYGENLSDKISSFIMEMDNNASYTDEEREGIISIYRMLNTMLNRGGAGIGQIVKNETPMTLGNMMESAKLYQSTVIKHRKFDYDIGDGSDGRISAVSGGNIRSSIEKAIAHAKAVTAHEDMKRISSLLEQNHMAETVENIYLAEENKGESLAETAYAALVLKNITEYAYPGYLNNLLKQNPNAPEMSEDDFLEFLREQAKIYSEDAENQKTERALSNAELLKSLANTAPQVIKWMNDNNIECTVANILAMQGMVKDPFRFSKKLDDVLQNVAEDLSDEAETFEDEEYRMVDGDIFDTDLTGLESAEDILKNLDRLDIKLNRMATEAQSAKLIEQINTTREAVKLQKGIVSNDAGNGYSVPVKLHDKISGLNMYFVNNNNETENILLAIDTNSLGIVQVYVNNTNEKLSLTVSSDRDEAVSYLQQNAENLLKYIKESGFGAENVEIKFASKQAKNTLEAEVFNYDAKTAIFSDYISEYETVI